MANECAGGSEGGGGRLARWDDADRAMRNARAELQVISKRVGDARYSAADVAIGQARIARRMREVAKQLLDAADELDGIDDAAGESGLGQHDHRRSLDFGGHAQ